MFCALEHLCKLFIFLPSPLGCWMYVSTCVVLSWKSSSLFKIVHVVVSHENAPHDDCVKHSPPHSTIVLYNIIQILYITGWITRNDIIIYII